MTYIYTTIYKTASSWEASYLSAGAPLNSVRCDDLEGWDGGEREAQEEEDICILRADSRCCMAETNTTL